jgi:hypothetical protein
VVVGFLLLQRLVRQVVLSQHLQHLVSSKDLQVALAQLLLLLPLPLDYRVV